MKSRNFNIQRDLSIPKDLENPKRAINFMAAVASLMVALTFIIRAAITGITYDEAFTYLAYARPLMDSPTISMVESIFWGSVANNHWLNTFLIALVCGGLKIQYSEFLIRLPSVIMGCVYLGLVLWRFCKGRLNGIQYAILTFCYYAAEFFGLARGYGMAVTLVFAGIILYGEWKRQNYEKHVLLLLSIGIFILSAYANSVTLVCCFCMGIVMGEHLILEKKLFSFVRKCWPVLILYAGAGLVIVKYHFRVSGEGMPLWASSGSSIFGMMAEYVNMLFQGDRVIRAVSFLLLLLTGGAAVYLLVRRKLTECDLGIACLVYFVLLVSMDVVFKRGGFYGRTLLPAYPLVALGIYELLERALQELREILFALQEKKFHSQEKSYSLQEKNLSCEERAFSLQEKSTSLQDKVQFAARILGAAFVVMLTLMYAGKTDLLRTRDWYDDYNIKVDFYCNPDFFSAGEHASVVFYQEKVEWDRENLFQEYSGEEKNSYVPE